MKRTLFLSLLLGITLPLHARQDQQTQKTEINPATKVSPTLSSTPPTTPEKAGVSQSPSLTILPEFIVTASRFSTNPFDEPFSTVVITESEIRRLSDRSIPEALKQVPGVMVQKTAVGHGSPYIRGFTGRQNLLMLDGVRLNNSTWRSGPTQYTNTVDVLSLESIELVKGQGSVLYGSDSIGGTLNLISQSSHPENYADGELFSHGSALYRIISNGGSSIGRLESNSGVGGLFGLHVGITAKHFGDIRDGAHKQAHTGYDELNYDIQGDWLINTKNTLTFSSRLTSQDDVWRTHKTIYGQTWHGANIGSADDFHYDQRFNIQSLKLSGKELNGAIDDYSLTVAFIQTHENEFSSTAKVPTLSKIGVDTLGINLQLKSGLPAGRLIYGADYYHDRISASQEKNGKTVAPALPDGSDYDLLGLYSDYLLPLLSEKLELRGGLRYTYAHAKLGDIGTGAEHTSKDWNNLVLAGRALYKIDPSLNVYAGVSQSFRAPNVDDLGANQKPAQTETFVNGNPNLKPESYLTYEVGSHYEDKTFRADVSTYYTRMNDLIVQTPLAVENGTYKTIAANSSKGWVSGVEADMEWEFTPQWQMMLSGYYTYGKADEYASNNPPVVQSNYISRLAPLSGTLALKWEAPSKDYFAELRVSAAAKADKLNLSDKKDSSRIPPGGTPGYYTVGIYAGWNITPNLTWTTAVENLTNQTYRIHGSGQNEAGISFINSISFTW